MNINGTLNDEELIEYIGLRLKLETINNLVNSKEYSEQDKVGFLKMYLKEVN